MYKTKLSIGCAAVLTTLCVLPAPATAELPAAVAKQLANAKYVYIASTRKDGGLSRPSEIWFLYHRGAVYVGTPKRSWRVRRIKAGRTAAKIWVGKPDGHALMTVTERELQDLPSFMATGAVVEDPRVRNLMLATYAKKYHEPGSYVDWESAEEEFKSGFRDGERVLVRYKPR